MPDEIHVMLFPLGSGRRPQFEGVQGTFCVVCSFRMGPEG